MVMRLAALTVAVLLSSCALVCGQSVVPWADYSSYATAAVNPTLAAVDAWRSSDRRCRFERLAISEGLANGLSLTLKHFIVSPRPCLGCAPDGFPSGHTANSLIGFSRDWKVGLAFGLATAELRTDAHRHTPWQVLAGAGLGIGAEAAGRLLHCQ